MKTCPYCGSELLKKKKDEFSAGFWHCPLCVMKVKPAQDGERIPRFKRKDLITDSDAELPLSSLFSYHTYDLLLILRILRAQRGDYFNQMKAIKRVEGPEFKEAKVYSGNEYERYNRKTFGVENLVKDRLGYIPAAITEKFLDYILDQMDEERNYKPMVMKQGSAS